MQLQETRINSDTTQDETRPEDKQQCRNKIWVCNAVKGCRGEKRKAEQEKPNDAVKTSTQAASRWVALKGWKGRGWYQFVLIARGFVTLLTSPWKPAVPDPVHGRVLVEIQRPRSLHRKAVIQLNTRRNQHNQSPTPEGRSAANLKNRNLCKNCL